jgi:hypothetical protein
LRSERPGIGRGTFLSLNQGIGDSPEEGRIESKKLGGFEKPLAGVVRIGVLIGHEACRGGDPRGLRHPLNPNSSPLLWLEALGLGA